MPEDICWPGFQNLGETVITLKLKHAMKQAAHVTVAMSSKFGSTKVKMTKAAHTEVFSFGVGCWITPVFSGFKQGQKNRILEQPKQDPRLCTWK